MIYYGTILMFLIFLTIVPIIVGFIIKSKPIRYFFWFLSLPFLLLTISTIKKNNSDIKKQTSIFLGDYKIDTTKSVYKSASLANYAGLTMTVYSNNTFEFGDTSMFPSKKGEWKFYNTEDGGFVNCIFPNNNNESLVFAGDEFWGFQNGGFRNSSNGDIIYFKKEMVK